MRRRNLIIASDSDEEGDAASTPSTSVSVASGGGGSGNVGRPSPQNPTPPPGSFYQPPSSPPPSPPVEISDDDDEFFDEIQDPDDDPFFVDIPDDLPAPPPPPTHPAPTTPTLTPTSAPPRPPPSTRTPTPTPPSAPAPPAWARTPTPTPPSARTPTPTPLSARTPTPTPPPAPAPARSPIQSPLPIPAFAPPPPARSPFPTPPSARAPTPTPPSVRTPTSAPPSARTPTSTPLAASTPPSALNPRLRAVYGFLQAFGLRVRPEWLESCAAGLPGFDALGGTEAQARRCFEQFLFADMNACGAGVLPEGVGCMDAAVLNGPFVLQVDEIVNISAPLRERYRDAHAGPKRCLKLSMTDGIQRVYGMEYRPIKDLTVLASAGFKVIIRNVHIRRGLLMLVPEVIEILLGVVDELEAARDRLVTEVNKPPRGKRKQGGLPLSSRAMLAAWASNINTTNGGEQGMSMPRTINSSLPTGLDNASQVCRTTQTTVGGHVNPSVAVNGVQEQSQHVQEFTVHSLSTSLTRNNTEAPPPATYRYDSQQSIRKTSQTMMEEHVDLPTMANSVHEQIQRVQEITMQDRTTAFTRNSEPSASTPCGYESPQQQRPHGMGDTDSVVEAPRSSYADNEVDQIEYPVILSGENEKPFTYIVNISNDQDTRSYIQGKIKGLITSVKHFNFKGCKEYELYIYIDDGSNISEAFVDHNIVQNIIGHSPEEVRVALYSDPKSATSSAMKETMKRFQSFLMKFEGTMFIEFNKNSPVPIVREMNEGCLSSDAWLLLRRTKAFSAPRHMRSLDFMDTTP